MYSDGECAVMMRKAYRAEARCSQRGAVSFARVHGKHCTDSREKRKPERAVRDS